MELAMPHRIGRRHGGLLTANDFKKGQSSPCNYVHEGRNVKITCHGDDFLIVAPLESIKWIIKKMQETFELKHQILGPEKGCVREVRMLNRIIRWTDTGIEYEPDQRHSDCIIRDLGLDGGKGVSTPGTVEIDNKEEVDEKEDLDKEVKKDDTTFRMIAARLNYLSLDRADLQYASRCISQYMSSPTKKAWRMLKRVGRYLIDAGRMVQKFEWCEPTKRINGFGDSDWAGDRTTAKSTSGGVISFGPHVIKTWSTTQQTIALSSGEAELYAMTKAATQVLGIMQLLADFGIATSGKVHSDSTAAIGIACRGGLGRTRHIRVQYLWIQSKVEEKDLELSKIHTDDNVADLMTKHLSSEGRKKHLKNMRMWTSSDRAEKSLSINGVFDDNAKKDEWINSVSIIGEKVDATMQQNHGEVSAMAMSSDSISRLINELLACSTWVRKHRTPRQALFTPMKVAKGPIRNSDVSNLRISLFQDVVSNDWKVWADNWKTSSNPHARVELSRGYTAFVNEIPETLISSI